MKTLSVLIYLSVWGVGCAGSKIKTTKVYYEVGVTQQYIPMKELKKNPSLLQKEAVGSKKVNSGKPTPSGPPPSQAKAEHK